MSPHQLDRWTRILLWQCLLLLFVNEVQKRDMSWWTPENTLTAAKGDDPHACHLLLEKSTWKEAEQGENKPSHRKREKARQLVDGPDPAP